MRRGAVRGAVWRRMMTRRTSALFGSHRRGQASERDGEGRCRARMAALRHARVRACVSGALARIAWFAFGWTCAWSVDARERDGCRWGCSDAEDHDEDVFSARTSSEALECACRAVGAGRMGHVRESFDAHLRRVASTLASWDVPDAVLVAGYGHTVYGSELFPAQLASFDRRRDVRALVGSSAERYMFLYATTSQRLWYRAALRRNSDSVGADGPSMTAVNFYTGQEMRLRARDSAMLSLMHAADILSVLIPKREPTLALACVSRLLQNAAELLDADGSPACATLANTLRTRVIADVLTTSCTRHRHEDDAAFAEPRSMERVDAECERLARSLRDTRSDVVFVLRATGVIHI